MRNMNHFIGGAALASGERQEAARYCEVFDPNAGVHAFRPPHC
jgi:hypothetical protein